MKDNDVMEVEASGPTPVEGSPEQAQGSAEFDGLIDGLAEAAQAAEHELFPLADSLNEDTRRYSDAIAPFERAWSRSNLGPHALMYFDGLQQPPPRQQWSKEWGFLNEQPGWHQLDHGEVITLIEREAGLTLVELDQHVRALRSRIAHHHDRLVRAAARVPHEVAKRVKFDERRSQLEELDEHTISMQSLTENELSGQHMSRDMDSLHAGLRLAPHQNIEVAAMTAFAVAERARDLVKAASRAAATAEGIRHLPPAFAKSRRTTVGYVPVGPSDRLTVVISATAILIVALALVAGAVLLVAEADSRISPSDGRFSAWSLIRSTAGGVGVLAAVLAASTIWYGLIQSRADHVHMTFGRPLLWGTLTAAAGVLLFIFGIA